MSWEPATRLADWSALWSKLGSVLGLAFVVALFAVLRPRTFLTADNFQIMLLQTAVVGTAALGTAQDGAIEVSCCREIVNREGDVERSDLAHRS